MLGAHTDSPSLKVKPSSSITTKGWHQIAVENYGGALLNSFLDRELCVAGRLTVLENGELKDRLVRTGPIARIPQLAPHLDHKRNELVLDKQFNMYPVWGVDPAENDVLGYMAKHVIDGEPVDPQSIVGYDLLFADSQPPRRFGADQELFASGRLDNLSSVHAGLTALERYVADNADEHATETVMLAAFDHEELGSESRSGAAGPFLEDILVRLSAARGGQAHQNILQERTGRTTTRLRAQLLVVERRKHHSLGSVLVRVIGNVTLQGGQTRMHRRQVIQATGSEQLLIRTEAARRLRISE